MQNDAISRSVAIVDIVEMLNGDTGDGFDCGYNAAVKIAVRRLRSIPSLYVAPVVHAKWLPISVDPADPYFRCSNCHHGRDTIYFEDEYNYCPNCGARMDGDAE